MAASVMTVTELAEYLKVHRSTVYRLIRESDIPRLKIGSDWRFIKAQIDNWLIDAVAGESNGATQPKQRLRAAK